MSTFVEMFSDFQDTIKIYTEDLVVTELSFMRALTRGIQEFQRETELVEKTVDITRQAPPLPPFMCPNDMLRPLDIRGVDPVTNDLKQIFIFQSLNQFKRNKDKIADGFLETPTDYEMRIPSAPGTRTINNDNVALLTIHGREIITEPLYTDTTLRMWYIPDLRAISRAHPEWAAWFTSEQAFMPMFTTQVLNPTLAPFEQAFIDYAVAQFIKAKGSKNYQVFEQNFRTAIGRAIETKPCYFTQGAADYMFAPWS